MMPKEQSERTPEEIKKEIESIQWLVQNKFITIKALPEKVMNEIDISINIKNMSVIEDFIDQEKAKAKKPKSKIITL